MRYWLSSVVLLIAFSGLSVADNRSDQMNPNNDAYWDSRGYDGRPDDWQSFSGSDDRDSYYQNNNRSNQLNPNNDAYWDSRGYDGGRIPQEHSNGSRDQDSYYQHPNHYNTQIPKDSMDWQVLEYLGETSDKMPESRLPELRKASFDFYEHHNNVISHLHTPDSSPSAMYWRQFSTTRLSDTFFNTLVVEPLDDDRCISTMVYAGTRLALYLKRFTYSSTPECLQNVVGLSIELSKTEKKLSKKELINRIWRELPRIAYIPPASDISLSLRDNDTPAFHYHGSSKVIQLDSKKGIIYISDSQSMVEKMSSDDSGTSGFNWLSLWK